MKIMVLAGISLALAVDAFAVTVGLACSLNGLNRRQVFRLAFSFGFFQFLMPILGWLIGDQLQKLISRYDHWVAFGLLLLVGVKMVVESFRSEEEKYKDNDPTKGWPLLILALATSLDALATGLSLPVLGLNLWVASPVIGLTAFALTVLASRIGPAMGRVFGRRAELAGGLILVMIGLKILFDHLG
ncbi:MAG: manganese efflux pump MntP family protein [Acidobacteriota bacterium]|nr:manganese efflux pump MntP family protein [Acidobacteriota bacterium]MDW3228476.1 manganese efflux pump MntP family protein [Acidobacteriota bacterium]